MKNTITRAQRRGSRDYQEDYYYFSRMETAELNGWMLAVMDGHDGKEVAEFCREEIGKLFEIINPDETEPKLRRLVSELNSRTANFQAGSTLSVAVILESHFMASIAILGDSPVVVFDKHGKLHASPEHNVRSNPEERAAVEKRGGVYSDGYIFTRESNNGLQLSRALGNAHLNEILSREPDIYTISDPQWVLVASDGVFDPSHEHTSHLLEEIKQHAMNNASAEDIVRWAEIRGLEDNATAIVWSLP
ncbi:MAG: hypothetical protein A3G49_02175 [Candidatus Sungbacteria bacterium RIFCSPLOWO2_12_FULL_41_11]|uniref:PPM-type phosphatase domain-containing protein n=1 Tax=Candidatus Sungbacteria bacterium RIFCSPLOWO2_12_FULL_41_11 TaxID=1802286 RepID=A0A1G2LQI4_9BACT|nr:MAG: hypothetical protein UV01_C0004G0025 [Parcubacteria group bacterium GW2011_GWA2_42_14]OGZ97865.1 MAG: hypothetical protein A3D41_01115 [Candidatus Sungbacteria bacterium RIFCSPHIGHO2_02_FULL_41_12b]OHA13149.1 MAG: hypothetical protein A3G49_02175 [Candidatus Sungbacteria bacterium RIFCSPLOWO2_12_FULL_41_11]